jgi:hypothetical protein
VNDHEGREAGDARLGDVPRGLAQLGEVWRYGGGESALLTAGDAPGAADVLACAGTPIAVWVASWAGETPEALLSAADESGRVRTTYISLTDRNFQKTQ